MTKCTNPACGAYGRPGQRTCDICHSVMAEVPSTTESRPWKSLRLPKRQHHKGTWRSPSKVPTDEREAD